MTLGTTCFINICITLFGQPHWLSLHHYMDGGPLASSGQVQLCGLSGLPHICGCEAQI